MGLVRLVERVECEPKLAKAWAGDVGAIVGVRAARAIVGTMRAMGAMGEMPKLYY